MFNKLTAALFAALMLAGTVTQMVSCGSSEGESWRARPAVWAEDIELDEQGCPHFILCCRGFVAGGASAETECAVSRQEVQLGLRGLHNVMNSCQAAAVGLMLGIELPAIAEALANALPEGGRQEVLKARGGLPSSMMPTTRTPTP